MSNIIKFPKGYVPPPEPAPVQVESVKSSKSKGFVIRGKTLLSALLRFIWIVTVLVWPLLKWIVSIEVFFQFLRMLYHWDTPDVHAGGTFLLHFAVLTALTYFVSIYKPRGI